MAHMIMPLTAMEGAAGIIMFLQQPLIRLIVLRYMQIV